MAVKFEQNDLSFCCGVSEIGEFWDSSTSYVPDEVVLAGTGIFVATYINDPDCKKAYEQMKEDGHKILFQSYPRRNPNSGNQVFIVVYLHRDAK